MTDSLPYSLNEAASEKSENFSTEYGEANRTIQGEYDCIRSKFDHHHHLHHHNFQHHHDGGEDESRQKNGLTWFFVLGHNVARLKAKTLQMMITILVNMMMMMNILFSHLLSYEYDDNEIGWS